MHKLNRWGDLEDDKKKEVQPDQIILSEDKANLILNIQTQPRPPKKPIMLKTKNPLVTQTIEVMHQTEMIQTLIDTYAEKSGKSGNYVLNHSQIMPNIDFPSENTADLLNDNKFVKPFWFVRPKETKFTRGEPKKIPKITKPIVEICLRKSICGLLKMGDFFESNESALVMFSDAVDFFYKSFMESLNEALVFHQPEPGPSYSNSPVPNERNRNLNIALVEKAYHSMTNSSLVQLHNYYKNSIINKNAEEIDEFNEILEVYKKLQQESQNLHRSNFMKEDDYLSYIDFGNPVSDQLGQLQNQSNLSNSQENIMSYLGDHQILNPVFDGEIMDPGSSMMNNLSGME